MFCAALHRCLFMRTQIQNRNLEPALQWVEEKRADLAAARQSYEAFEFQLHRLQFLRILTQQGACHDCSMCVRRAHTIACLVPCHCYSISWHSVAMCFTWLEVSILLRTI